MSNYRLSIELLPKGAWENDLSKTLSPKNWDIIRLYCYKKAKFHCEICGTESSSLHAHEIWNFNPNTQTQKLINIVALCPACHGVKHFRNSERIGYGEYSKKHFMKVNNCSELEFAKHYLEAQLKFEELNKIYRWKMIADLTQFGGINIKFEQKEIPLIKNLYKTVDFNLPLSKNVFMVEAEKNSFLNQLPKIRCIDVDNYRGTINLIAENTNKIFWKSKNNILQTQFNSSWLLKSKFCVQGLKEPDIQFTLYNENGKITSLPFKLINAFKNQLSFSL